MREALTLCIFSLVVLIFFGAFAATGFLHGAPDICLLTTPDTCYCEHIDTARIGMPGIRQPWNTWSNLMGIFYGGLVAWGAYRVRTGDTAPFTNRLRAYDKWGYPLIAICVVTFLGLGSMWFHGSIVRWAGYFDLLSMFTFTIGIAFYALMRCLPPTVDDRWWKNVLFLAGYLGLVFLITSLTYGLKWESDGVIFPIIVFAAGVELANFFLKPEARADWRGWVILLIGAVSFGLAFTFWTLSQTGGPLCFPTGFQFHALWHWLAGVTSVAFFFYFVRCKN
ncbi:MAG TPA: ceramidase domain-containing protein [Rhizomicrobium sp.]|nr:ceramidase domain-containing protein [Rhizomicrobium sp.]